MSCGRLQYDNTLAYPLVTVSTAPSPAFEDVRNLVQLDDLIYSAAGSGGLLVYRIVDDAMSPVLSLSLTNLYSEDLEQVYIRTVEILKTESATNLIFAYDTLSGGGIGVAELTLTSTTPLGSLQVEPGIRIKNTVTTFNPQGVFNILAASENIGVVSYDISFISNSYFELSKIASLVDFISTTDVEGPVQNFLSLDAPNVRNITNIGQITNMENLVQLALDNPTLFATMVEDIPFITKEQKDQIQQILSITNQPVVSNILDIATGLVGKDAINQLIANPQSFNSLLNSSVLAGVVPEFLEKSGESLDGNALQSLQSNITPGMIEQAQNMLNNTSNADRLSLENDEVQNLLSLSGLQQRVENNNNPNVLVDELGGIQIPEQTQETETLFEEFQLSNINLAEDIDTKLVHDTNFNPFINRPEIGDARLEIEKTVDALGRKFFVEENIELKNRLLELSSEEIQNLFSVVFEQVSSSIDLIPLFENSGINIGELYQLWQQGDYYSIINGLDPSIIAELLRRLPRYQITTSVTIKQTNLVLPAIRNMESDSETLYIAAGSEGLYIVDKISGEIISSLKKPFSEVTMIVPYERKGKKYYVVTDKLDGLIVYERKNNRKIGEQISRISLVGESFSVFPYEDVFWVADGSNGVVAVRFNRDRSLTIEAEVYKKSGIAYHIGVGRRREVLASYGADGLMRLRITNVPPEGLSTTAATSTLAREVKVEEKEDIIDRLLVWSQDSELAQFIKRMFL